MIKRIRFATRRRTVTRDAFTAAWPGAVTAAVSAPADVRPTRVTVCTTLPELTGPDPKHDGVVFEWFDDPAHLGRFESWLVTQEGQSSVASDLDLVDDGASPVVVAEAHVLRGADWLDERWRDGGTRLKHLAIALRSADLSAAEFSQRWRHHAGQGAPSAGGAPVVIPEGARGLAYAQNHPLAEGEWAYDALTEVWFDEVEGLRTRIEWFRANPPDPANELFGRSWFLAAREDIVA